MSEEMPPPGRERDEQIAKALGWTRISLSYRVFSIGLAPDANNMTEIPEYSTTSDCMELLVYARAQTAHYRVQNDSYERWVSCSIYLDEIGDTYNSDNGGNEADAISGAFLLWMRAREKKE